MNPSRPAMRRKLFQLAFEDLSKRLTAPRKARRKMARVIRNKAWQAYRSENVQQ